MNIAVFGGAHSKPGDEAFQQGILLGEWIAQNGHTVLTGGYMGIMEAVSQGAAEKGGHVIGVTCEELENWRQTHANRWVKEEWKLPTLRERLWALLEKSDLGIAMPGGAGTLAEISMLWNHQIIGILPSSPIILIGEGWRKMFKVFFEESSIYIAERDCSHLQFAENLQKAIQIANGYIQSKTVKPH
jgi:uncharacterized protein (TIGR00730 family)